jgi:hypothetical protein
MENHKFEKILFRDLIDYCGLSDDALHYLGRKRYWFVIVLFAIKAVLHYIMVGLFYFSFAALVYIFFVPQDPIKALSIMPIWFEVLFFLIVAALVVSIFLKSHTYEYSDLVAKKIAEREDIYGYMDRLRDKSKQNITRSLLISIPFSLFMAANFNVYTLSSIVSLGDQGGPERVELTKGIKGIDKFFRSVRTGNIGFAAYEEYRELVSTDAGKQALDLYMLVFLAMFFLFWAFSYTASLKLGFMKEIYAKIYVHIKFHLE